MHVPVIYYAVSFGGLIVTDAEVLYNDKKSMLAQFFCG